MVRQLTRDDIFLLFETLEIMQSVLLRELIVWFACRMGQYKFQTFHALLGVQIEFYGQIRDLTAAGSLCRQTTTGKLCSGEISNSDTMSVPSDRD